jgi:hypothetical protein
MQIVLGGTTEGRDDDPLEIRLGGVVDQPVLQGPVDKSRLEDLQMWSALHALAFSGLARHPLGVRPGVPPDGDPPDRWLSQGDRTWGVELTQLTLEDFRSDLAQLRSVARDLGQILRSREVEFAHLRGGVVEISKRNADRLPKNHGPLLTNLESLLKVDRGIVGQDSFFDKDPPKRGYYGNCGPFVVWVNPNPGRTDITISASSPSTIHRSEALQALGDCVREKDIPGNEVLIVTCGLPDEKGYRCLADESIFGMLWSAVLAGGSIVAEAPANLRGVLVHLWSSTALIHWPVNADDLPWSAAAPVGT